MPEQAASVVSASASSRTAGQRTRLVLVDDHAILRDGLRALLEIESDLEVVAEASNFAAAMDGISRLRPALVITDIVLPGRSGLDLIRSAREKSPETRFMVLTAHDSEEYVRAALDAHADGYVLKDANRSELLLAIRTVMAGHRFHCSAVAARIVSGFLNGRDHRGSAGGIANVTAREREVLTMIALGHPNKTIARGLGLSVKTIEKHRSNLMRKLELHNAAGITRYALSHQLIGPDMVEAANRAAREDAAAGPSAD